METVHWAQLGKKKKAGKGGRDEPDRGHDYCVYLREGGGARGHQNLTHAVVEALHWLIIHTQETLSCPLFSHINHKLKVNYLWKCQGNKKQLWPPLSPTPLSTTREKLPPNKQSNKNPAQPKLNKLFLKTNEDSLRDLRENIKHTNIHITGVLDGEKREREKTWENIWRDNSWKLP